jgi:hypothetical protein
MKTSTKHLLSFSCIIVFAFFALASRVNKIHYGAFNYSNRVEDPNDRKNFLELNNGTHVYGDKISWKAGLFVKDQIKIDDQKYKLSEVRGYQKDQVYYGRLGNDYIQRIIHGKINVYVQFTQVTTTSTDHGGFSHTYSYTRTDHYSQLGDKAPLVVFGSQKDIRKLVEGCPLAEEMAGKSNHQIRKSIRSDRNYMNEIFETYNNGCKEVTRR